MYYKLTDISTMAQHLNGIHKVSSLRWLFSSDFRALYQGYYCFCLSHLSISSCFFSLTYIHFKYQFNPCSLHPPFPFGQETTALPFTKYHFLHAWFCCSPFAKPNSLADKSWSDWAQTLIWLFSTILTIRVIFNVPQTSNLLALGWFQLPQFLCNCHPIQEPSLCF